MYSRRESVASDALHAMEILKKEAELICHV